MSGTLGKVAPVLVVLAMVAWCGYSTMDGSGGGLVLQGQDLPRVARADLVPKIEGELARNPFDLPEKLTIAVTAPDQPIGAPAVGKEPDELAGVNLDAVVRKLRLHATFIQGDRQVAVINGKPYELGALLAVAETVHEPWIVRRISAHRVLLEHQGEMFELNYGRP